MGNGRIAKAAVTGLVLVGVGFLSTGTAVAACHAFEISVSPATVGEGDRVTVTVSRDAAVNPSSVDVTSVDGSARAGEDYEAVERSVSFTAETEQTFSVATVDNGVPEGSENFRLHLSNPSGCAINPNFQLGPDATVTISDNDAAAPTRPPTTAAPTTAAPTTATTATTAPDTTVSDETTTSTDGDTTTSEPRTTTTETESETEDAAAVDDDDDDDGGAGAAVTAMIAIIAVVLAAAYLAFRRRVRPQE